MNKFLGAVGALAMIALASPAAAVSPSNGQAQAKAAIYKPLALTKVQNLDFGVIVEGPGVWPGEVVSISQAGVLTCGGGTNLTCSGSPQVAKYHLSGTNNAAVTVTCPGFNLTGPGTLAFTPTPGTPTTISLGAAGSTTGVDSSIGGSITVASTTPDGVYTGT